ncbi:MAG: UDP-N-acetylmuramate dehydrogenase [Betaproteobacteria bacterium]
MDMSETHHMTGLRGELKLDEPMGRHVSWRTGGRAARTYRPAGNDDLAAFLRQLPAGEQVMFLGLGSNSLVRDGGFGGTVVFNHASAKHAEFDQGLVFADVGVASPKVARFAATHDLAGSEFLAGIPGSIGGALAMNAGCYGSETWEIVARVQTIDRAGKLRIRPKADFDIAYRHCELRDGGHIGATEWFTGAWFCLEPGDGEASRARIKELLTKRIASQPLSLPNAGSVFRNPPGDFAARLIESCGLKGLERGGARVSEKHANFIVNPKGAARASDIEGLIETVRATVKDRTGIDLHPEVRIFGEAA